MRAFAVGLCSLLISTAAIADDFCRAALASLGAAAPPNVYVPTDPGLSHWRALKQTESVAADVMPMVYLRPGSHAGAVTVKITKTALTGEAPAATVNLRRRDDIQQCGIDSATRFFWFWLPSSYADGVQVGVDEYVRYHRTRTPNARLERFHIRYVGRGQACIATNDPSNGNREQFLYGEDRRPGPPLMAVVERTGLSSTAFADPSTKFLRNAAFAETQIAVYPAADGCASFDFRSAGPGSYQLRLNDLEQRDVHGRRPGQELERKLVVGQ
ncbi:MAG: hypothetical protein ACLPKB_12965 [Xanthobacteraceae bacterium]